MPSRKIKPQKYADRTGLDPSRLTATEAAFLAKLVSDRVGFGWPDPRDPGGFAVGQLQAKLGIMCQVRQRLGDDVSQEMLGKMERYRNK